jgi:phage shock protein B
MGGMLLTTIMIFLLPLLALIVLGGLVLVIFRLLGRNTPRFNPHQREEETRLIQEIHQGLSKMEKRIEALETILLDPERKDRDAKQN